MHRFIRKVKSYFSPASHSVNDSFGLDSENQMRDTPLILSRDEHNLSRAQISKECLDVLNQLKRAGYEAYLVGGAVRDLLLGIEPKDFDVVTSATPEQVKGVFKRQCRLIGRRFRLAHVMYGRTIIEVATFRGGGDGGLKSRFAGKKQLNNVRKVDEAGRLLRDNIYGTIDEDVWRRDFTVNSLYYNIKDFSIVDYAGALNDIELGQLRLIGDPELRYREDPVRIIRAIRFAAKLGFNIEAETEAPIPEMAVLLRDVSNARLFEEVLKLFHSGVAVEVFEKCRHYHVFEHLFPLTDVLLDAPVDRSPIALIVASLRSTDERINNGLGVNPSFLFAAFLWAPMMRRMLALLEEGLSEYEALCAAGNDVIEQQIRRTAIPKRFTLQIREIWSLQFRLEVRSGDRAQKLFEHPRFRAAYDFLGIRVAAGMVELAPLFDWWTRYQELNPLERVAFANEIELPKKKKRRRNSRNLYKRKSAPAVESK